MAKNATEHFFTGEPGEFKWINKEEITIDYSYQRSTIKTSWMKIASNFNWTAFGAISVADRYGTLYVTDGSHRLTAAKQIEEIVDVPCMVFPSFSSKEEAETFLTTNNVRSHVPAIAKYKAKLVIEDEFATIVNSELIRHGYRVSDAGNNSSLLTIKCVASLQDEAKRNPEIFRNILQICVNVTNGKHIHDRLFRSLAYLEPKMNDQGLSLLRNPWKDRIERLGTSGILEAAGKASAFYAYGSPKIWAYGIVNAMNKGLKNRLIVPGIDPTREDQ